jgi:hypothetical protein
MALLLFPQKFRAFTLLLLVLKIKNYDVGVAFGSIKPILKFSKAGQLSEFQRRTREHTSRQHSQLKILLSSFLLLFLSYGQEI